VSVQKGKIKQKKDKINLQHAVIPFNMNSKKSQETVLTHIIKLVFFTPDGKMYNY